MKQGELAKMDEPALEKKMQELRKELVKGNAQVATGTIPKNPRQLRNVKKTIARIHTLLRKKELEHLKTAVTKKRGERKPNKENNNE